jgi:hypothetical protein
MRRWGWHDNSAGWCYEGLFYGFDWWIDTPGCLSVTSIPTRQIRRSKLQFSHPICIRLCELSPCCRRLINPSQLDLLLDEIVSLYAKVSRISSLRWRCVIKWDPLYAMERCIRGERETAQQRTENRNLLRLPACPSASLCHQSPPSPSSLCLPAPTRTVINQIKSSHLALPLGRSGLTFSLLSVHLSIFASLS